MSTELAVAYAALALHDDNVPVTAENILKLCTAAGLSVEPIWANLFAKVLETRNIGDLLMSFQSSAAAAPVAAAPVAAAAAEPAAAAKGGKKEAPPKEESDEELGMGLFD